MNIQRPVIVNLLPTMCFCWGLPRLVVSLVMSASMGKVFAVPDVPELIFSVSSVDVIALLDGFCSPMGLSSSARYAGCPIVTLAS